MGIRSVSPSYEGASTGLFGFAPYSADTDNRDNNFIFQLKQKGFIDDLTLSFYLNPNQGNHSHVKFGGFDPDALKDSNPDNLKMYRTNSLDSWEIQGTLFRFGSELIFPSSPGEIRSVDINPEYSYIYMPDKDYLKFIQKLASMFERQARESIVCNYNKNYCKFTKNCDQVRLPSGKEFRI